MSQDRKPVHVVRYGALSASVWANQFASGGLTYSVSFQRSYKDDRGEWQYSSSFFTSDLPSLSLLAAEAYRRIQSHRQGSSSANVYGEDAANDTHGRQTQTARRSPKSRQHDTNDAGDSDAPF